jgi:virginiamycin B lyase
VRGKGQLLSHRAAIALFLVLAIAVSGASAYYLTRQPGSLTCSAPHAGEGATYQADKVQFGAVTEYCLANPSRWPNAVVQGPDGSVWFGEEAVPGVGRLFPSNGTVVEYPWPGANGTINMYRTGIWGLMIWNGMIWGADNDGNALVGYNSTTGSTKTVNATGAPFPYTLAASPDGSMWFTSLHAPAVLGRISPDLTLQVFSLAGLGKEEPIQMQFVNSSLAYVAALNPLSSTGEGALYSFDPRASNGTLTATRVGGNFSLFFPDSLSVSPENIWVSQHYPANVADYNMTSAEWTVYPTSTVTYEDTTLPYFIEVSPSSPQLVWFNEHYGNRIALLDSSTGSLTEYSEANPQVTVGGDIQNDLTIAATASGLWFTSTTGNYIGFVDETYDPGFGVAISGQNHLTLAPSGSATARFTISGTWSKSLEVKVSDTENFSSVPSDISIEPSQTSIQPGSGPVTLDVVLAVQPGLSPGRYTAAVTVTDGLILRTAYVFIQVT